MVSPGNSVFRTSNTSKLTLEFETNQVDFISGDRLITPICNALSTNSSRGKAAPGPRAGWLRTGDLAFGCNNRRRSIMSVVVAGVVVIVGNLAGVGLAFDLNHHCSLGTGV
ncbi:hypothetical protein TBK1r_47490 [Stieleria magnilauensis]|uniref:Uncharacterized protein n=1 Tax=Stieleria magnilauensis TaxID=2527963 RepID=A0ABX5XUN2_9BACT|nr:hypothetical protein TBK1r_47490 [Planctomycetes bacterium TBK1r]